jgi:hypothetical protein
MASDIAPASTGLLGGSVKNPFTPQNYMENVIQAATVAAQLSAHRRSIMDMLVGCPLITTAEYDTAMQRTLACQDLATLQKWYRNTVREIARREELEPVTAPITYATATQKEEIIKLANRHEITRPEKTAVLLGINQLTSTEASATIGTLWGNIVTRAGHNPLPDGWSLRPEVTALYANAA